MNHRLLLFSRDPGGANALIPLVEPLRLSGFEVFLYGKDYALVRYESNGLSWEAGCMDDPKALLKDVNPDCIITSTSAEDFTEKLLWSSARQLRIPSIAVLDQWMNYGIRFSGFGIDKVRQYREQPDITYFPDKIAVMDAAARQEMLELGFKSEQVVVTGQPYFQWVREHYQNLGDVQKEALKTRLGIPNASFILTFASQPFTILYPDFSQNPHGYNEHLALKSILNCLQAILSEPQIPKVCLLVKIHPRENLQDFEWVNTIQTDKLQVIVTQEIDSLEIIGMSDAIIGMSSMLLMESFLAEKPTLSIQSGLIGEDPLMLSRRGYIDVVTEEEQLQARLRQLLSGLDPSRKKFAEMGNSISSIIALVQHLIASPVLE